MMLNVWNPTCKPLFITGIEIVFQFFLPKSKSKYATRGSFVLKKGNQFCANIYSLGDLVDKSNWPFRIIIFINQTIQKTLRLHYLLVLAQGKHSLELALWKWLVLQLSFLNQRLCTGTVTTQRHLWAVESFELITEFQGPLSFGKQVLLWRKFALLLGDSWEVDVLSIILHAHVLLFFPSCTIITTAGLKGFVDVFFCSSWMWSDLQLDYGRKILNPIKFLPFVKVDSVCRPLDDAVGKQQKSRKKYKWIV